MIIFQKNAVRGVTTAAGLWVAAAVGLGWGAGMWAVSSAAAALTIICLETMHLITRKYGEKLLTATFSPVDADQIATILDELKQRGIGVDTFSVSDSKAVFQFRTRSKDYMESVRTILSLGRGCNVDIS